MSNNKEVYPWSISRFWLSQLRSPLSKPLSLLSGILQKPPNWYLYFYCCPPKSALNTVVRVIFWNLSHVSHFSARNLETVSVQFSCSVMCDSLWPNGLQRARLPWPSPTPRAYSNSCPSSQWCHPVIQCCHLILYCPFLLPSNFLSIRVFFNESVRHIRWPKYWSFSFNISPSNEYSGLISFQIDWYDNLAVQGTREFSPTPQFKSISSSALSFLYSPTLTSIRDYWKNHSFDSMDHCWQSNVSAF